MYNIMALIKWLLKKQSSTNEKSLIIFSNAFLKTLMERSLKINSPTEIKCDKTCFLPFIGKT